MLYGAVLTVVLFVCVLCCAALRSAPLPLPQPLSSMEYAIELLARVDFNDEDRKLIVGAEYWVQSQSAGKAGDIGFHYDKVLTQSGCVQCLVCLLCCRRVLI